MTPKAHCNTIKANSCPKMRPNENEAPRTVPRLRSPLNKDHIKKPLNAFMLYMKEMRPKMLEICENKEK